jgi:hypothetical protein
MKRIVLSLTVVSALVGAACGGKPANVAPLEMTCRTTLPPRPASPSDSAAKPAFAAARSTILIDAEVPLTIIKNGLEAKVGKRVAEERDHDLGIAGRLEYTVDRGPFAVSVQGDTLVVEAPMQAHARACAKGSCYAGCDPEARVTARVPLRLGADYKFRPSQVRIDVTRGCELRAVGGLVRLDLTPILQARLAQETKHVEAQIDAQLPNLRGEAERIWGELGKARPIALGACVVVAPSAMGQGPATQTGPGDHAHLRFALHARPEVRMRCGDAPAGGLAPLPPLVDEGTLPPEGDVHLGVVLPPAAAGIALESADPVDLGGARARVSRASGVPSALALDLTGEACGAVALRASDAAWNDDGRSLHLAALAPLPGEAERLAAAGLDASALAKGLEHAPIVVPLAPDALRATIPDLARALQDDRVAVEATVSDAHAENAGIRGDDLVAVVKMRGNVTLRAK